MDNLETGKQLIRLRVEHGLNQSEMADVINVSQSMYSKFEKGKSKLSDIYKEVYVRHFNINSDYFNTSNLEPIYQSDSIINPSSTDMETNYLKTIMTLVDSNAKLLEENIALRSKVETLESSSLGERKQLTQSRI